MHGPSALGAPFARNEELYRKLEAKSNGPTERTRKTACGQVQKDTLPGHPSMRLNDPCLREFLAKELCTPTVDSLQPVLWLIAKQDSAHVSSLTHQLVRGRNIVLTENPELHLAWIYDRVFIKPLPKYLTSHTFWRDHLVDEHTITTAHIGMAARGFLRTYGWLIQHKSDFSLAKKHGLVSEKLKFADFVTFITACQASTFDAHVSPRYHYGELRLTRINLWMKIWLRRIGLLKVHGQYGAILSQYYGPILFILGVLSVSLSAAQVGLAVQPVFTSRTYDVIFEHTSQGLAIASLLAVALSLAFLFLVAMIMLLRELIFATKDLWRRRTRPTSSSDND